MKRRLLAVFVLAIGVCITSGPLLAHHGGAAYDTEKRITLKGTVTQWFWANPHCVLMLDVTDDAGQVVHWGIESENPSALIKLGWSRQSMKPGDQISVTVMPVKNGKPIGRIQDIVLADGQKLPGPRLVGGGILGPTPKPENEPKP